MLTVFGCLMLNDTAISSEPAVPEPFRGFDEASTHEINYDDLTELLRSVVVDTGRSDRQAAEPAADITGTRMKVRVKKTADEGNRFFFETFKESEKGQQFLRDIQASLQQLPTHTPLEHFSRDEQLAYWLNLYNVTVLNEIIEVYPKRNLKKLFRGKNSIFAKKLLTVAGVSLSLNDIHFTILKQNYDNNPLVIYGLYQGIVGGPNIRTSAYSGDDVWRALEENADEFVNSNRGTFTREKSGFRVSSFYARNRAFFPDFDSDLSQHLLQFLDGNERVALQSASTLKPDIDDFTVTDLGGTLPEIGRSLAHNNAALLDSYKSNRRSTNGGVRVASLEVQREKKNPRDDDDEELAKLEKRKDVPVEGADVEQISTEDVDPED